MVKVQFSVKGDTAPSEAVYVTGSSQKLGAWCPQGALRLQKDGDVWNGSVHVDGEVKYRYFIGSEITAGNLILSKWEAHQIPRFRKTGKKMKGQCDIFGEIDGVQAVQPGWLTSQTEIHLRLYDSPVQPWGSKFRGCVPRVRCRKINLADKEGNIMTQTTDNEQDSTGSSSLVMVSVLDGKHNEPQPQSTHGTSCTPDDYIIFKACTEQPDTVAFQLDVYVSHQRAADTDVPEYVGTAHILPQNISDLSGNKTFPLTSNNMEQAPVGHITVDYLVIQPLEGIKLSLEHSPLQHWNKNNKPLHVGHRGLGSYYGAEIRASEKENTAVSLSGAWQHGADFVEFDVQLSKDKIPVIYHDFQVCLPVQSDEAETADFVKMPVQELTLKQLQSSQLYHVSVKNKGSNIGKCSLQGNTPDEQPFMTLRDCLEELDPDIGFNVEIKYCLRLMNGDFEEEMTQFMEKNQYLDAILKVLLQYSASRKIIISTFEPDICTMTRLKQSQFPVVFLTQGDTKRWDPYLDLRTRSIHIAANLAKCHQLLGVAAHTEDLLNEPSLVQKIRDQELALFCWGSDNNNTKTITSLIKQGVHGVIYDRVDKLKPQE